MWIPGQVVTTIDDVTPLVAQWEKATHPAQVRLNTYLDGVTTKLRPLPPSPALLFLHLHVRVPNREALLRHCDLENYLTPLFGTKWLDPRRFSLVIGTKDCIASSRLTIGIAKWHEDDCKSSGWAACKLSPTGGTSSREWKEQLRQGLQDNATPLPPQGPVSARIALWYALPRNWASLWKPVGDAMGPILGYTNPAHAYHPKDDRITHLELHGIVDPEMKRRVEVSYQWKWEGEGLPH